MNTTQSYESLGTGFKRFIQNLAHGRSLNRGTAWGLMILGALLAFEIFNFSTTQFALRDVLGDLTFGGLQWATILAVAFCGIDFAGIARLFTPQQGRDEPTEIWYLFGAWLLAAGFNAALTWWGVSVAIVDHRSAAAGAVVSNQTLINVVPVFVAVMVWLIRVLIIGTFSVAGDKLFSTGEGRAQIERAFHPAISHGAGAPAASFRSAASTARSVSTAYRPAPRPASSVSYDAADPIYTAVPLDASGAGDAGGPHHLQ